MEVETELQFPLDTNMCIVFTGYYNGVGVEVRSLEEMKLLYHMGCFGKGTASRSGPKTIINNKCPPFMRKRQFVKRNYWFRRFSQTQQNKDLDTFFTDVDNLVTKISNDTKTQTGKEIIDLVSSDEETLESEQSLADKTEFNTSDEQDIVVIVPNSDSEDDNYFAKIKPKCCINKILLQEKLMLTLQEAFFLLYGLGCLQVINSENNILSIEECWQLFTDNDCQFIEKYVVYHYFRSKGYIVKPGIKFGGDYLLYKEGPGINHADYIVIINFAHESFDWIPLLGQVRMAATTVKEILIAEVNKSKKEVMKLPQDLCEYSVRELIMTRNIPINNDED